MSRTEYFTDRIRHRIIVSKGSDGLMDNVSSSQPRDRGFEPHTCHDHDIQLFQVNVYIIFFSIICILIA